MVAGPEYKGRRRFPFLLGKGTRSRDLQGFEEQKAASQSTSGSPGVMGKRFLGQEKQSEKEELPIR